MTEELKTKSKKPIWKRWWVWAITIFLIIIIFAAGGDDSQKEQSKPAESPTQSTASYITTADSPERKIEEKFIQIMGAETNMDEQRIRQIKITTYDYANNYQNADIEYLADENLSTNLTKRGMWVDAKEILKELPNALEPQIMKITLNPHLKLVDVYGEESVDRVMTIRITRDTWEKISWDNFLTENVPNIAETYWEHPALSN